MSREPQPDRNSAMKVIKDKLFRWTCEQHATDYPLDRHLLRDKALKLASEYGLTGFKCSHKWLTSFLKKHGFSLDPNDSFGPIFSNYRFWIDAMRSVIMQYRHKDLFHLDELTMYSDVSPTGVSSAMYHATRQDASLKRMTVLMCCNASGTEKSPLLICGTYPALLTDEEYLYIHSEDASISDNLLGEWLSRLNDRMSRGERKILLLLHRNRVGAFRGLELSNVRHVFFPENFPSVLRPLKRDVFHFVKMIYRSKYVEGIKEHGRRWNVENAVESMLAAWQKVPRELIIASFQRTSFRTDDCFLEIHCDAWDELDAGMSFEKFVKFDDDLLTSQENRRSTGHNYNLRIREEIILTDDELDSRRQLPAERVFDESQAKGDSRGIYSKMDIDRKKKSSLKRSHEEAQLDKDSLTEIIDVTSPDNPITGPAQESKSQNKEVIVVSSSAKRPKIMSIEILHAGKKRLIDASTQNIVELEEIDPLITSGTNVDHVFPAIDDVINHQEAKNRSREASRGLGEQSSMESSWRVDISNASNFASQQVLDDTFVADSAARDPNTSAIPGISRGEEAKMSNAALSMDGNDGHSSRRSPKKKRSRSINVEHPLGYSDDGEPECKKLKPDYDWTKRYETTFVFGSASAAFSGEDTQELKQACETPKSIFTIKPRKD